LKVSVESEELSGHAGPESVGAADGLIIELLIVVQVFEMSAGRVLVEERLGDVEGVDLVSFSNLGV
jgi:hypothetical protein